MAIPSCVRTNALDNEIVQKGRAEQEGVSPLKLSRWQSLDGLGVRAALCKLFLCNHLFAALLKLVERNPS